MSSSSEWSSSSSESSLESFEEESDAIPNAILPYQFEPEFSSSSEDGQQDDETESLMEEDVEKEEPRTNNLDWCTCDNCQRFERNEECKCCLEIPQVSSVIENSVEVDGLPEAPKCITEHPGFQAVCLNKWVLRTSWFQYKQQYAEAYEGRQDKLYRHIAYRQLARWCWGVLGKEIRVPLPSCAVCCIRAHFPPPGLEEDFVFEGFRFPDE